MPQAPETPHSDQQVPLLSPPAIGTIHQHYKGHQYKVLGTLIHEETGETFVHYQKVVREAWPRKGWQLTGPEYGRSVANWFAQTETGAKRFIEIQE